MKKIFLLLFVIIINLISYKEAKSDCPPGWFENVITSEFQYQYYDVFIDCLVKIVFCCRWNPDLQMPEIIPKGAYAESGYNDCFHMIEQHPELKDTLIRFIFAEMSKGAKTNPNCFPQCPPCDENIPKLYYRIIAYKCVKWISKPAIRLINGTVLEWADGIEFCDNLDYKCILTYACCCDWNTSPPSCYEWCVSAEPYGTSECSNQEPQVPPPGKDWNEPWETECFITNVCRCP
jgi:hypothetical protein